MSNALQGALNEATEILRVIGEDAGETLKNELKDIARSITVVGTKLIKGEMDKQEADLTIGNLLRASESALIVEWVESEKRIIQGVIRGGVNVLTHIAAGV